MSEANNEFNYRDAVSLKEYFDARLLDLEKSTNRTAQQLEKRFEGVNEFRESLKDQASRFITRTEVETSLTRISEDIKFLREDRAKLEGKASQSSVFISWIIAGAALLISIGQLFVKQ